MYDIEEVEHYSKTNKGCDLHDLVVHQNHTLFHIITWTNISCEQNRQAIGIQVTYRFILVDPRFWDGETHDVPHGEIPAGPWKILTFQKPRGSAALVSKPPQATFDRSPATPRLISNGAMRGLGAYSGVQSFQCKLRVHLLLAGAHE